MPGVFLHVIELVIIFSIPLIYREYFLLPYGIRSNLESIKVQGESKLFQDTRSIFDSFKLFGVCITSIMFWACRDSYYGNREYY